MRKTVGFSLIWICIAISVIGQHDFSIIPYPIDPQSPIFIQGSGEIKKTARYVKVLAKNKRGFIFAYKLVVY